MLRKKPIFGKCVQVKELITSIAGNFNTSSSVPVFTFSN